jgi:hypothetical protein
MHTPSTWSFLCYRNDAGRNLIYPHLSALSKQGMMNLRRTLEHLRVKPQTSWDRPQASPNRDWMHDRERRGWEAPNQAINPVATLVMSADFAAALAKALAAASKPLKNLR